MTETRHRLAKDLDGSSLAQAGYWGFLVTNDLHRSSAYAGMSHFVWFQSLGKLRTWLSAAAITYEDSGLTCMPLESFAPHVLPLVADWNHREAAVEEMLGVLSGIHRHDSMVTWIGSFEELCEGDQELPRSVRLWYRKEEGLDGGEEAVPPRERGSFACALQAYGI